MWELSDDQRQLQRAALEFARATLTENMVDRDRESGFDRGIWQRCAEFGVLGMPVPAQYGGMGLGLCDLLAVMEGLGNGARDQGILFSLNAHLWTNSIPILIYGTAEQQARYLPGLCDGTLIGANAASEPGAGSDIFSMRTVARRDGDCYVLDGAKTWVTNGPVAGLFVADATVNPALGGMGRRSSWSHWGHFRVRVKGLLRMYGHGRMSAQSLTLGHTLA